MLRLTVWGPDLAQVVTSWFRSCGGGGLSRVRVFDGPLRTPPVTESQRTTGHEI
jgi:hypothetical protein